MVNFGDIEFAMRRPYYYVLHVILVGLLISTKFSFGQANDAHYCIGNLVIANWTPSSGSDGPQIGSVALYYEFMQDSNNVTKKYKLNWFLGDYVILNGVKYSRSELGNELFESIQIDNISFKAKIYSDGKFVDEIIFDYPSKIPRSGGESGWYVSGSSEWNKLFDKIPADKATEICKKGFEVKNPQIYSISFKGLDKIRDAINKKEGKTPPPRNNGTKEEDNAKKKKPKRKRVSKTKAYFRELSVDIKTGNIKKFKGNGWHINLISGLGLVKYPINVNEVGRNTTGGFDSLSSRKAGYGYGLQAGAEIWPMFGKHWGFGGYGKVNLGWSPRSSITNIANYGVKAIIGAQPFYILFDMGKGIRSVSWTHGGGDTAAADYRLIEGEANFDVDRISVGIRTLITRDRNTSLNVIISFEQPDYLKDKDKWITLWHLYYWHHNLIKGGIEFTLEYDSPGRVHYPTKESYLDHGFYIALYFSKSFDFFGRPYKGKKL